jgi:catechol 2,3-dioxygenase-like lactoylglutathione lyase family enzyme
MITSVVNTGFTVSDMGRALAFYTGVLPFDVESDVEVYGTPYEDLHGLFGVRLRVVTLRLGDERLELSEYLTPTGRSIPADSRSNDGWFQHIAIVVSDMDAAYAHLRRYNVRHVSTAPQTLPDWNTAAAGIRAFYFRDPDGHNLEVIYFPKGKGAPRWQGKRDLFLGIDHTAISVRSTEESLRFYGALLGLRLAGESTNYGIEQEHLNQVEGAKLHISGLRASCGMGIEFLEYLHPRDGRPMPADSRPNDLWHWQTTLRAHDLYSAAEELTNAGCRFVSRGVVTLPDSQLGFTQGLLVRDPDGHVIRVTSDE